MVGLKIFLLGVFREEWIKITSIIIGEMLLLLCSNLDHIFDSSKKYLQKVPSFIDSLVSWRKNVINV